MKFTSCLGVAILLAAPVLSSAQVQLSSLGRAQNLYSYIDTINPDIVSMVFHTDAQSYQLNSVTLNMTEVIAGTLNVQLFAVSGGHPTGSALFSSFVQPTIPGGNIYADVTFATSATYYLSPSTAYALVLSTSGGEWIWGGTNASNGYDTPGGHAWTFDNQPATTHDWITWNSSFSGIHMAMNVNATPVPEPATATLWLGLGVLGLVGLRARLRRH